MPLGYARNIHKSDEHAQTKNPEARPLISPKDLILRAEAGGLRVEASLGNLMT